LRDQKKFGNFDMLSFWGCMNNLCPVFSGISGILVLYFSFRWVLITETNLKGKAVIPYFIGYESTRLHMESLLAAKFSLSQDKKTGVIPREVHHSPLKKIAINSFGYRRGNTEPRLKTTLSLQPFV